MVPKLMTLVILTITFSCNVPIRTNNQNDYYSRSVKKVLSPEKDKYAEIIENGLNKNDAITQIAINFGYPQMKGGGGIFTAKGIDLRIDIIWLLNNDLLIKYPKGIEIEKQDSTIQFLSNIVNVFYQEKLLPDSLTGQIIKYESIGIMDTITAILNGKVIDNESKISIENASISLMSGLVLTPNSTDKNGLFKFNHIHAGSYRIKIFAPDYNDFDMDTLNLGIGDIKELNIGMIKK
jgi:hypothetical protein